MATLEEVIRQRLAAATTQISEAKKMAVVKDMESEEVGMPDEIEMNPKKKSMCKEDFDAMTQEEFDSIDEDQLDELSKATLGSYVKKASGNMIKNAVKLRDATNDRNSPKPDMEIVAKNERDSIGGLMKRDKNISKAVGKMTKEDTVSSQVSALLEAEGLSEDFKLQAVTIFEAAVSDKVLLIEEELRKEFDSQLAEAKTELDNDIDGFLSEAVQKWTQDNEVAIKANFKSQLAESFMDGMRALISEHNIEVPEDKEDALEVALGEVDKLNESIVAKEADMLALQESINELKADKILESFKEKMTQTEFDRFVQLTESVQFKDVAQYEKQLTIVLENFGNKQKIVKSEQITEEVALPTQKVVTESTSDMSVYAKYLTTRKL
jgi:hypothetical protein